MLYMNPLIPVRRFLGGPLGRLREKLDDLGEDLRTAIAKLIGETVSATVKAAVQAVLGEPEKKPTYDEYHLREESRYWDEPEDPWTRELEHLDEEPQSRSFEDSQEAFDEEAVQPAKASESRWSQAVSTGFQASAWWLRRHPGRYQVIVATGIGLVAGTAALFGKNPFFQMSVSAVATVLSLVALTDIVRVGASVLAP